MKKNSYLFLAEGFEEIEALTTVDLLRRAGIDVTTVAVGSGSCVKGAHGIPVEADTTFDQIDPADILWMILPGGLPGTTNLRAFEPLCKLLQAHAVDNGLIAAICAAPAMVLADLGILNGREATGYPGTFDPAKPGEVKWSDAMTIVDRNIITGKGPAAAMEFALAIIARTLGDDAARTVASGLLYKA